MISWQHIKVVIFDFDGTLVDSNSLKKDAFFELFNGGEQCGVIKSILDKKPEASRYIVLKEAIDLIYQDKDESFKENKTSELVDDYGKQVTWGAKTCRILPGALEVLETFKKQYTLFLSSNTPEIPLKEIIEYRKWGHYFKDIFGYPRKKSETVNKILVDCEVKAEQVCIIGDGDSDFISASENQCHFVDLRPENTNISIILEEYHGS